MNSIKFINNNYPQQRVNFGSYFVKPGQLGAPALKGFTDVTDLSEHVPYLSAQQFDGISEHLQRIVQAGKKLIFSPDEMKEIKAVRNDKDRMMLDTFAARGIQGDESII